MDRLDIGSLANFEPPRYRCGNCLALWRRDYISKDFDSTLQSCRHCGIWYENHEGEHYSVRVSDCLAKEGYAIEIADPLNHANNPARIARNIALRKCPPDPDYWHYPYMKGLLHAFTITQSFVHFTSFGNLPDFIIRVLELAAKRISAHGVVSTPSGGTNHKRVLKSIDDSRFEATKLDVRVTASEVGDLPHQKLVIIDGLLAFKGSANLTDYAWRKAEDDKEQIEVVTGINEVIDLNNRFFSPVWRDATKDISGPIVTHKPESTEGHRWTA